MNNLFQILSRNLTELKKIDLEGEISTIRQSAFQNCLKLKNIEISDNITTIMADSFSGCPIETIIFGKNKIEQISVLNFTESVTSVYLDEINEKSNIGIDSFVYTNWYKTFPTNQMILAGNNKILLGNTIIKPSQGFSIPQTVTNLGRDSCGVPSGQSVDSNFITFTIPNHIKYIQNKPFGGNLLSTQQLKTISVSDSVEEINGTITCGSYTTILIFKHPAGKYIKLPQPGSAGGLAYNKDSRALTVYTDNEYIKNYNWTTDNATVTFYPLANAPVGV